jgi:hypothetical protein
VFNGKLHYLLPTDIDKTLHDDDDENILAYGAHYNTRPSNSISFMCTQYSVLNTSDRLHCDLVRILFL